MHMAGVPIHFPHTPYRAQNALMYSVVTAIKKHQHALVESPTGTGKSLALLCSSLASQKFLEKERDEATPTSQKPGDSEPSKDKHVERREVQPSQERTRLAEVVEHPPANADNDCDSDDSDFAPQKKFRDTSWQKPLSRELKKSRIEEQPENTFMFQRLLAQRDNPLDEPDEPDDFSAEPTQKPVKRVPRIFYATRTHNQVAQVIGELRKTAYRPRISILASRREYCVREDVRALKNRDETCKALVKAADCRFYRNAGDLAHHEDLRDEAWDIEELTELGKKHAGCPYYASHELYQSAQLILCPYSFLVDPLVRRARGINISGDVVILDEAHNIEAFARDAAGFEASVADIRKGTEEVEELISTGFLTGPMGDLCTAYQKVKSFLECFLALSDVVVNSCEFQQYQDSENAVYEQSSLLEKLAGVEVTSANVRKCRGALDFILSAGGASDAKKKKRMMADLSSPENAQSQGLESKSHEKEGSVGNSAPKTPSAGYGYGGEMISTPKDEENHADAQSDRPPESQRMKHNRRRGKRRKSAAKEETPWGLRCLTITNGLLTTLEYLFSNPNDFAMVFDRRIVNYVTVVTMKINCLNAAVCFQEVSGKARSVVVTSGTLSPLSSFAGELGTTFTISKTLPHVIDVQKQLFVGVAGNGPRGVVFDATFNGAAKFAFQDSLGDALADYCRVIPGGVLVFFPSYRMMDQLRGRWMASGVLEQLETIKGKVLFEPNTRGEQFDSVVAAYDQASRTDGRGAVLMGVCRGKFSEGIDFRDSTSRAVLIIGIPFPHKGDLIVSRKKSWNDRIRLQQERKELQSGMEWYEMQAFRALNQALGRTVRHRYDYGAILLIDCRFRLRRMVQQLPEWTKAALQAKNLSHAALVRNLQEFYNGVQDSIATIAEEDERCKFPRDEKETIPTP